MNIPVDWKRETFSTGRLISDNPAITSPHLNIGAQKWTVLGPFKNEEMSKKAVWPLLSFWL